MRRRDVAGEAANDAGLQVDHEGVAEAFVHEGHALVIRREVGTLTEMGKHFHVLRKGIERIALLSLGKKN